MLTSTQLVEWHMAVVRKTASSVSGDVQRRREKEKPLLEASLKVGLSSSSPRVSPLTPADVHTHSSFLEFSCLTQLMDSCQSERFLSFFEIYFSYSIKNELSLPDKHKSPRPIQESTINSLQGKSLAGGGSCRAGPCASGRLVCCCILLKSFITYSERSKAIPTGAPAPYQRHC